MSDNYIVSARKYRPQTFDTVVGQSHITTTLKNAIRNQHLAHAYLFCGPRGVGKTTCARILAKTINCESPTADTEACGLCSTCLSLKDNASFNVFELDAASNNSVDDIRELTSQVRFAPQNGRYKVYIIDEVHMLSAAAFNAFLKTLEEPPPYAIFILATTEKHKILPTILSRCQIFDFKRIVTNDIVDHLQSIAAKESMVANESALHVIALKSEGCMRDALSMLDRIASFTNGMLTYANTMEHLNILDNDFYFKIIDAMLCQDVPSTLLYLDNALERGFEGDVIIEGLAEQYRNLLLCKHERITRLLDLPKELKIAFQEKALQIPVSYIISALNVLNTAQIEYKNATNRRLHVEICLIRLCYLLQAIGGEQVSVDTEDEKKNSSNVAFQPAKEVENVIAPTSLPTITEPNNINYNNTTIQESIVQQPQTATQIAVTNTSTKNFTDTNRPTNPKPNTTRRVSLNLLGDIDSAAAKAAENVVIRPTKLAQEDALKIFEEYKEELAKANKGVLHSQFCLMSLEMMSDDEVRLISPSELTNTYAIDQRTLLIEFFSNKANMNIRITTETRIDTEALANKPKVMSRSEIFEFMANKNPALSKLKEVLNMQIEF